MRMKLNTTVQIVTFMICATLIIISVIAVIGWIFTPQMIIDINFNMMADDNAVEIVRTFNNSVFGEIQ